MEDLRYVQDVKGTRVTYTIFAHKIPDEFMSGENHEIATPEGIEEYAKSLVDTMYKYGYQGIDLDYERLSGISWGSVQWSFSRSVLYVA